MSSFRLLSFPEHVLDRVIHEAYVNSPACALMLLSQLGYDVSQSAIRVIFERLELQDDSRCLSPESPQLGNPISAILLNRARYGTAVRHIQILDPTNFCISADWSRVVNASSSDDSQLAENTNSCTVKPISAAELEWLLLRMPNLERFEWRSATCPPDGICEMLASSNNKLSCFIYEPAPSLLHAPKIGVPRWDGMSLPLLADINLTTLHLSRLSHIGARSLSHLLTLLEQSNTLETISIDTNWLDENVCSLLGNACRKVKRLHFASDGTRLNDNCIIILMSLFDALEEFTLGDIQGRLSKGLWEHVEDYPQNLTKFHITISEATLQHPWAIDHLASLSFLPLSNLTHLSIKRVCSLASSQIHEIASLKPIPSEFVSSLREATRLQYLACDWWCWTAEDLKIPLEHCRELRFLLFAFNGTFAKFLGSNVFIPSANSLESIGVFVQTGNPILPPSPATTHRAASRSPSSSPLQSTRRLSTSVNGAQDNALEDGTVGTRTSGTAAESNVHLREIRKFARRATRLRELTLYGAVGIQGSWAINRNGTTSAASTNLTVECVPFTPVSESILDRLHQEEMALGAGWNPGIVEREGAAWTGTTANQYHSLRQAEKCSEERQAREDKAKKSTSRSGGSSSGLSLEIPKRSLKPSLPSPAERKDARLPSPISPKNPKKFIASSQSPSSTKRPMVFSGVETVQGGNGTKTVPNQRAASGNGRSRPSDSGARRGNVGGKRGKPRESEHQHQPRPETNTNGSPGRNSQPTEPAGTTNRIGSGQRGGRGIRSRGSSRPRRSEP